MNFFDIRKLQAAMSQIKVEFLKAGIDIDDIDLQNVFALSQTAAHVTPSDFTSEDLHMDLNAVAPEAQSFKARRAEIIAEVQKIFVNAIFSGSASNSIHTGITVVNPELINAIAVDIINVFKEQLGVNKVATSALERLMASLKEDDLSTIAQLDDIQTKALDSQCADCGAIIVEDKESIDVHGVFSEKLGCKYAIVTQTPGMSLSDIDVKMFAADKTKIIAINEVVADAFDSVLLEMERIEESIKAKFIANLVGSSQLAGAINIGFSQQTTLTPSAVLYMLMSLGVESVLVSRADASDSEALKMNLINIRDEFSKIGVNNDSTVNAPATLNASFTIKSRNEVMDKEAVHATPDVFKTGTTIYAFVDQDSASAIISMFQLFFGAQVQVLSNSSGVRNVMDEEIEGQIKAEVSAPTAGVLEKEIVNITASARCVLGGYIIKFLRDYQNTLLSEMNNKTLAELCREEF